MNNYIKSWTSLFYSITCVNSLSFVLFFIINNLIYLSSSSATSNSVQVLLNDHWNTYEPQTPFPLTNNSDILLNFENAQNIVLKNLTNITNNKLNSELNYNNNDKNETVPLDMQWKRFMWNEVDETMDSIAQGFANSAKMMKSMVDSVMHTEPGLIRYKKAAAYYPILPSSATNVKYVLKSPLKRNKVIKLPSTGPKRIIKIFPSSSNIPHFEALTKITPPTPASKLINSPAISSSQFKFLDEDALRDIEKKTEEKVEATIISILPVSYGKGEIITGTFKNSDNEWRPVVTKSDFEQNIYSSTPVSVLEKKSKPMSHLHTKISDLPLQRPTGHSYEVTENSAEETIEEPHTYKPHKYAAYNKHYKEIIPKLTTTTTDNPNYSNYFILHTSNSTTSYATNDIKLPKRRNQSENVSSSSYSYISRAPKYDGKNKTITTTMRSILNSSSSSISITQEPIISVTLKKKIRNLENIGGYKDFKDSQTEENRNYPLKISSVQQINENDEHNKQDRTNRNRGTKRFGDRLR